MSDLADFLLARIAEDEATAHSVEQWQPAYVCLRESDGTETWLYTVTRALAECDAKRRIIELHSSTVSQCPRCADGADDYGVVYERYPCATLRLLVLPYADHPDYQQEWAL